MEEACQTTKSRMIENNEKYRVGLQVGLQVGLFFGFFYTPNDGKCGIFQLKKGVKVPPKHMFFTTTD
jgi:hypothetical protein